MITAYAPINFGNIVAGSNAIPVMILGSYFYARFTGILVPLVSGLYTVGVNCQDGCNVFLGTQELVSNATGIDVAFSTLQYTRSTQQYLTAGIQYPIIIEWVVGVGGASVGYQLQLIWTPPASNTPVLIPATVLTNDTASITGSLSGSWWNGTSALYYPNGESTIDFANTSHPNKTLDYIPDGLTRKLFGSTGNTPFVAGADNSIAIAPNGNIVSTDGSGNVQDSGIAVSAVSLASGALQRSGGTMTGTLNMITAAGIIWNSDTSLARDGASGALFIGANGVGSTVSLRLGGAGASKGSLIFGQTTAYQTTITGAATANWTLTLPPTAGTNTYVLQTDGSGNTSWVAQSGGTPSGVTGAIQYNNSSTLGGSATTITAAGSILIPDGQTLSWGDAVNAGLSYGGATGAVYVGNGTAGDYSGSLKLTTVIMSELVSNGGPNAVIISGADSQILVRDTAGSPASTDTIYVDFPNVVFRDPSAGYANLLEIGTGGTLTVPTLKLAGGTSGYVLSTDGSGNTSWVAQSGGTPLSVAGDLLYENSTPAPARLGIGSTGQVLTVVGGLPAWANSASGFSNPMTNEGDIIYENASLGPARLPIGSTGQVLTVAGGVPTWATGAAGALVQIAQQVISGSSTTSVTFSGIPGTYSSLRLTVWGQTNRSATQDQVHLTFNGDGAGNYNSSDIEGGGGTSPSQGGNNAGVDYINIGNINASTSGSTPGQIDCMITGYASTAFNKTLLSTSTLNLTTSGQDQYIVVVGGNWLSTAAITSITLVPGTGHDFVSGTVFTLYGLQ
jgi:hypothetical protein